MTDDRTRRGWALQSGRFSTCGRDFDVLCNLPGQAVLRFLYVFVV